MKGLAVVVLAVAGCDVGVLPSTGLDEPLIVEGAQFFPGPLPSSDAGPAVVTINSAANFAFAGQAGKQINGDVGPGSTAILMRFADLGTGYWSVPIGAQDPQMPGDFVWSAALDFAWTIPPGTHAMDFTAIDANGVPGPIAQNPYLIQSPTPTGDVVISLAWDSAADLDLHVLTPSGQDLDPKNPTTAPDAGDTPPPGTGTIDRDSNAGCVQDGFRQEDASWMTAPPPGAYLVSVDMFSACGAASADFVVTVRVQGKPTRTIAGRLLASDADGGGPGLFVVQLQL